MNDILYLKRVQLSGYKSIEEVEIEFQKGFNIIIGKNAAGKTNFVDGKHELLPVPNSQILISGGKLTQNSGY